MTTKPHARDDDPDPAVLEATLRWIDDRRFAPLLPFARDLAAHGDAGAHALVTLIEAVTRPEEIARLPLDADLEGGRETDATYFRSLYPGAWRTFEEAISPIEDRAFFRGQALRIANAFRRLRASRRARHAR